MRYGPDAAAPGPYRCHGDGVRRHRFRVTAHSAPWNGTVPIGASGWRHSARRGPVTPGRQAWGPEAQSLWAAVLAWDIPIDKLATVPVMIVRAGYV